MTTSDVDTTEPTSATPAYGWFPQPTETDHHGRAWEHDWHQVAGRLLTHLDEDTTDSLDSTFTVPVDHYLDPQRWEREIEARIHSVRLANVDLVGAGDLHYADGRFTLH